MNKEMPDFVEIPTPTSYDTTTVQGRARAYTEELVHKGYLPQMVQENVLVLGFYAEHLENEKAVLENKLRSYEHAIHEFVVSRGTK